ncbi:MAG: hypothetical protein KF844_08425 [Cryobacterium sp.]|nr:hypothetical protein [Cryobacterium sp.]
MANFDGDAKGASSRRPGKPSSGNRRDAGKPAKSGPSFNRRDRTDQSGYRKRNDSQPQDGARDQSRDRARDQSRNQSRDRVRPRIDREDKREQDVERIGPDLRSVRSRFDAPEIPDEVKPGDLDRVARAELKTLSAENAEEVARHLVMAGRLINEDPDLAHKHALAASRRAGRVAVVRETLAITAYMIGDFALALRELRTNRRLSGKDDLLPMMVDCERGLGRPERALELGRSVKRETLPIGAQVELAIAMSGARLDLGQTEQALIELQIPQLDPTMAFSWSPGLFDAYATVLEDLGRKPEAETWFARSDAATAALQDSDTDDEIEIEVLEELSDDNA